MNSARSGERFDNDLYVVNILVFGGDMFELRVDRRGDMFVLSCCLDEAFGDSYISLLSRSGEVLGD